MPCVYFNEVVLRLPLCFMSIVFYSRTLFQKPLERSNVFVVQTIFLFASKNPDHQVYLITEKGQELVPQLPSNCQVIAIKAKRSLLESFWWDFKLPRLLKKINAAVFISFDNRCSMNTPIPQCLVTEGIINVRRKWIKKASLILVSSQSGIKLIEGIDKFEEKIKVVYPGIIGTSSKVDNKELESIKKYYGGGKEFFLYNSRLDLNEQFIDLLKSFSIFKRRQQSGMNLLIMSKSNPIFEKNLASYKYREDVKFIDPDDENEYARITAVAYAVVLPFNNKNDMLPALEAMQYGVPVIVSMDSPVHEISEDAALFSGSIKETADNMMRLYTNEQFRSELIENGRRLASGFTIEKTAELWWRSIKQFLR